MFCHQCGATVADNTKFCPYCGAGTLLTDPTPAQKAPAQPAPSSEPVRILIRSHSNRFNAESWQQTTRKRLLSLIFTSSISDAVLFLIVLFFCASDDRDLRKLGNALLESTWLWLLLLSLTVVLLVCVIKDIRDVNGAAETYYDYCSKENLVVDTEKIYGNTANGKIKLYHHQIRSVTTSDTYLSFRGNASNNNSLPYSRLVILDASGNRFTFSSFSNAMELCSVIDSFAQK